jgi:chromosome segregation ATPase
MARPKSAVLTGAQRKEVTSDLKSRIKTCKESLKILQAEHKEAVKLVAVAEKQLHTAVTQKTEAAKSATAAKDTLKLAKPSVKDSNRAVADLTKQLQKLEAELNTVSGREQQAAA